MACPNYIIKYLKGTLCSLAGLETKKLMYKLNVPKKKNEIKEIEPGILLMLKKKGGILTETNLEIFLKFKCSGCK